MSEEHNVVDDVVRNQKNYVAIVLDKSGSMASLRKQAVDGLNEYIQTVQNQRDQTSFVTLCTFSNQSEFVHFNDSPDVLREITQEQYVPNGGTAMLDAVGDVLTRLEETTDINDKNNAYLVVVISDGQENASTRFTQAMISEKVKQYTDAGNWTFVYIGANQDLREVSKSMGVGLQNSMSFNANSRSYCAQNIALSDSTKQWYEDRKKGKSNKTDFFTSDGSVKSV